VQKPAAEAMCFYPEARLKTRWMIDGKFTANCVNIGNIVGTTNDIWCRVRSIAESAQDNSVALMPLGSSKTAVQERGGTGETDQ
jgi:hypothetical protein